MRVSSMSMLAVPAVVLAGSGGAISTCARANSELSPARQASIAPDSDTKAAEKVGAAHTLNEVSPVTDLGCAGADGRSGRWLASSSVSQRRGGTGIDCQQ